MAYSLILKPSGVISGALSDGAFHFFMVATAFNLRILELEKMRF